MEQQLGKDGNLPVQVTIFTPSTIGHIESQSSICPIVEGVRSTLFIFIRICSKHSLGVDTECIINLLQDVPSSNSHMGHRVNNDPFLSQKGN